jgi:uncharacterized protein
MKNLVLKAKRQSAMRWNNGRHERWIDQRSIMGNRGIRTPRVDADRRSWSFTSGRRQSKEKKKSTTERLPPTAADCDEIASVLQQFARGQGLAGSSFKAIGALSYAKLGWFNWETKKYDPVCVLDEQVELLSLIGDIALRDGEPQVHAHVVVGRSDGTAHGGYLLEARVRPTCELILTESPIHLQKKLDPKSGIALIQI